MRRSRGQGTLKKVGSVWQLRVRYRDEEGKVREKNFRGATKSEAEAERDKFCQQVQEGVDTDLTLGGWADHCLEHVIKVRTNTLRLYKGFNTNHLKPLHKLKLPEIDAQTLDKFFQGLELGPGTKKLVSVFLSGLFNQAVRYGKVKTNPVQQTRAIKGEAKEIQPLTAKQVKALLAECDEPYSTIFALQVYLGLRIGEVLGLTKDAFDGNRLTITKQALRNRETGDIELVPLKTSRSRRVVMVPEKLMQMLNLDERPNGLLFPATFSEQPIAHSTTYHYLQRAAVRAGIGKIGTHTLRHTYGYLSVSVGTNINVISSAMGHTDLRTTLRYSKTSEKVIGEANDKLAEALD